MDFDPAKSFDENLKLFLTAVEQLDPACAKILADNITELCREGDPARDAGARARFHNAVKGALETLPGDAP